jgi:hypothetical protein
VQKISSPSGFDPRTVQPVASRYTGYSIPAHIIIIIRRRRRRRRRRKEEEGGQEFHIKGAEKLNHTCLRVEIQ